jgi:hypothetical protein
MYTQYNSPIIYQTPDGSSFSVLGVQAQNGDSRPGLTAMAAKSSPLLLPSRAP